MTKPKSWTLKSIAQELGVSNATVSNAFNRPDQLSKARREKFWRPVKSSAILAQTRRRNHYVEAPLILLL